MRYDARMTKSQYLTVALEAVAAAEAVIMQYFSGSFDVQLKPDQTPVTVADQQAERIIKETILRTFPDHGFLGEEEGAEHQTAEWVWVIDPIDGTKNFVRRLPFFGTQLALMHGDEIVLGVSNLPAMHELIYAEKGAGAFLGDQRLQVSTVSDISQSYLSFGGLRYFEKHGDLPGLLSLGRTAQACRGFGDCWSYHLLAKGLIDGVMESQVKIWDIAAIARIVQEAGGSVTEISGEPITQQSTTIIASNGVLHANMQAVFAGSKP